MWTPFLREEKGQSAPFVAISSLLLLATMGLAADGGWSYVLQRAAQNAADAGARAAARQVAYQDFTAADSDGVAIAAENLRLPNSGYTVALTYSATAAADPNDDALWSAGPPTVSTRAVRARVSITGATLFMGIIGIYESTTGATGVVTLYNTEPFSSWDTLFPLAIPVPALGSYIPGSTYYLWGPQAANFASYYNMPSQWKGLINMNNDPNTGTAEMSSWATTGYPGAITIGDQLLIYAGGAGATVSSGLQAYILAHPYSDSGGTYTYIRIATFNAYNGATQKVTINGFQMFKVYYNAVSANSAEGIFVGYLNLGGTPVTASYTAYGPLTIKTTG